MKYTRRFSLFLILLLKFTLFSYAIEIIDEDLLNSLDLGGYMLKNDYGYLNIDLYEDKNLIVYGDNQSVMGNDFKEVSNGYYSLDNKKGEYRYHGFTLDGLKYLNDNFPRDSDSGLKMEDKLWIYKPWENDSQAYEIYKKYVGTYSINEELSKDPLATSIINNSVSFVEKGTNNGQTPPDLDGINYVNVLSVPTSKAYGEGISFHISKFNNKIYYQTMPLNKTSTLKKIPFSKSEISNLEVFGMELNGDIKFTMNLNAQLEMPLLSESILKATYYSKEEVENIKFYLSNSINNDTKVYEGMDSFRKADLIIRKADYKDLMDENGKFEIIFTLRSEIIFSKGISESGTNKSIDSKGTHLMSNIEGEIEYLDFKVNGKKEILEVDKYGVDIEIIKNPNNLTPHIKLDGIELFGKDKEEFLNGDYMFTQLHQDIIYDYSVYFIDELGKTYSCNSFVLVHDSLPRANIIVNNPGKVGRIIDINIEKIRNEYLEKFTNSKVKWLRASNEDGTWLNHILVEEEHLRFYKNEPGKIKIELRIENEYGYRDVWEEFVVSNDLAPEIFSYLINNVILRNEPIELIFESTSLDMDGINSTYYLVKDVNDTVIYDSRIEETLFTPKALGDYIIELHAVEKPIDEVFEGFVPKEKIIYRELYVVNSMPFTYMVTDIKTKPQKGDIILILDKELTQEDVDNIKTNKIFLNENIKKMGIDSETIIWNLKPYELTSTGYDRKNTKTAYPPSSITYSQDGFMGTLYRYNVDNYKKTVDEGVYVTKTESKYVTESVTNAGYAVYKKDSSGKWVLDYQTNTPSYTYNQDGFKGTLSKLSVTLNRSVETATTKTNYYNATFGGTVTKTYQVWESDYVTYNNYYGDYSGTVVKSQIESFSDEMTLDRGKILIYIFEDELDQNEEMSIKSIYNDTLINEIKYSNIEDLGLEIDRIIKNNITNYEKKAILVNEEFIIENFDYDYELDPIINGGTYLIHEKDYFENDEGYLDNTSLEMDFEKAFTFDGFLGKPGRFIFYRRIEDRPLSNPQEGKVSNIDSYEILIHRRPISNLNYIYDYNPSNQIYEIEWKDLSFDPDFERSQDRGIISSLTRYRDINSDLWFYSKPKELKSGNYIFENIVIDNYGEHSFVQTLNMNLPISPDIQILRFDVEPNTLPASELFSIKNLLTRYPYPIKIEIVDELGEIIWSMTKSEGVISSIDNDLTWGEIQILTEKSFKNNVHNYLIKAIDISNPQKYTVKPFGITIKTPFELRTDINILKYGDNNLNAFSSKYVNSIKLILFKDESYEKTIFLSKEDDKWAGNLYLESNINKGEYNGVIIGTLPSLDVEIIPFKFLVEGVSIDKVEVKGSIDPFDGSYSNRLKRIMPNAADTYLGLENINVKVFTSKNMERVEVSLTGGLGNGTYKGKSYRDYVGYDINSPISLVKAQEGIFETDFILPLGDSSVDFDLNRIKEKYKMIIKGISKGEEITYVYEFDILSNIYELIDIKPSIIDSGL